MLVLALARATQPLAAYEAFLLAGADHPRHRPSAFSVNALLAALVGDERVDLAERAFGAARVAGPVHLQHRHLRALQGRAAPQGQQRRAAAAGRDCVPRQRNSVVAFQSQTGVEVCTFSLILKNAASLLTNKDPLKVEADSRLRELIQSFSDLGTLLESSNFEVTGDRREDERWLAGHYLCP